MSMPTLVRNKPRDIVEGAERVVAVARSTANIVGCGSIEEALELSTRRLVRLIAENRRSVIGDPTDNQIEFVEDISRVVDFLVSIESGKILREEALPKATCFRIDDSELSLC